MYLKHNLAIDHLLPEDKVSDGAGKGIINVSLDSSIGSTCDLGLQLGELEQCN